MRKHTSARLDRFLTRLQARGGVGPSHVAGAFREALRETQRVSVGGFRRSRAPGRGCLQQSGHDALERGKRSLGHLARSAAYYSRKRPLRAISLTSLLAVLLVSCLGGIVTLVPHLAGASTTFQPNTYARFRSSGDAWERGHDPFATVQPRGPHDKQGTPPDKAAPSSGAPLTHPIRVALDAQHLYNGSDPVGSVRDASPQKSSDGILELRVADHSVDIGQATFPGAGFLGSSVAAASDGPLTLELKPATGTFRGQSTALAGFALHVLDAQAHEAQGVTFHAPLLLTFHYQPHELDGLNIQSLRLVWPATADQQYNHPAASVPVTAELQSRTLTASVDSLQRGAMVLSATPTDANPASSEHLTLAANEGDVTFAVPFDLPPAAGGVAPDLRLVYSSGGPNGRYARNAPAPWTGDGWDLSLGSISYDGSKNLYYLNGVGGVSDVLLCCHNTGTNGVNYFVPHHHADVRIFASDNSTAPYQTGASFIVRAPNGTEYDLGATPDSIRSTVTSGAKTYLEWDVNKVWRMYDTGAGPGALQQYTVSYWQDWASSNGISYTRDAAPREIDYNYSGGSPLARVAVNIHWPGGTTSNGPATATDYGTNYHCSTSRAPLLATTLRCDDPVQPSGYEAPPLTMSTLTLDTVVMQVQRSGVWHTARTYQLSYAPDTPAVECWDDYSGQVYACDGEHLLTSVLETPYQTVGSADTAMPSRQPITFTYSPATKNEYHDTTQNGFDGNMFDAQTWWQYLTGFSDQQSGAGATVVYKTAYGNTHGVPSGSVTDPFTCDAVSCTVPEDRQWPRQVVASITNTGSGTTTTYSYGLNQACGTGCTQDTWIPPNAWNACGDAGLPPSNPNQACLTTGYSNYYQEEYTGFLQTYATHPDGSTSYVEYYAGNGWGTNDWDPNNLARPTPLVEDEYQGAASGTPLREVWHTYPTGGSSCPSGVSGSNQLYNNPYMFCLLQETQRDTYLGGGSGSSPQVPHETQTWTYDPYIWFQMLTAAAVTTNDLLADSTTSYGSTQPTFTAKYGYTGRDGTAETPQSPYYFEELVQSTALDDNLGNRWSCSQTLYDGLGFLPDYRQSSIKEALPTQGNRYTDCGTSGNGYTTSGTVSTGVGYDTFGQPFLSTDPDALAGVGGHTGCTPSSPALVVYPVNWAAYSDCTSYDSAQHTYPSADTNALKQQRSAAWDAVQGVPTSSTDSNGAVTSYAGPIFEYSGSPSLDAYQDTYTQTTLPGETYGSPAWTTRVFSLSFCAGATSAGKPCTESDIVRQIDGTNLAVSRQFYDRDGRLVETRVSGPTAGQDTVQITSYDDANAKVFQSLTCSVPALSTGNGGRVAGSTPGYIAPTQTASGSSAYVDPTVSGTSCSQSTLTGTTTYYDALGRAIATDDPMGTGVGANGSGCLLMGAGTHHTTCIFYAAVNASPLQGLPTGDAEPYLQTFWIDADLRQNASYADALGRVAYRQVFSGSNQLPWSGNIAPYSLTSFAYDGAGNLARITDPFAHTTIFGYDKLGRQISLADPDRGSETYSYDADGNVTQTVDAREASGTVYAAYDGLDRQLWRNTTNSGSGAYVTYSYDSTANGNSGVGRLTGETFSATGGTNLGSGSYSYAYDARGRTTATTLSLNGTSYPVSATYTDFDTPATLTYPTGETLSSSYNAAGALLGLARTSSGGTTTLWDLPTYSTASNTAGLLSSARLGQTQTQSTVYDGDWRTSDLALTRIGDGATLFNESLTYDNAGNVSGTTVTLPAGTLQSQFCYDEQERLHWVGTSGSSLCTGVANNGTTLAAAQYTAKYTYDSLDRMTAGPLGSATYGDAAHLHAATAIGSGYTTSYDASGNMTCRATTSIQTCASGSSPTGAALGFDAEGRLIRWQNAAASPTSSAQYLYDGQGHRVERQVSDASGTSTTVSVGTLEELTSGPTGTTTTTYFTAAGQRIAVAVNGALSYLATDHLGSPAVAVDASGTVTAQQLYAAYGTLLYASGTMPGSSGYTGQRSDLGTSGLDDYGARSYDPTAAQFVSADTVLDGVHPPDRYAYGHNSPQTYVDPSGHCDIFDLSSRVQAPLACGDEAGISEPDGPPPGGGSNAGGDEGNDPGSGSTGSADPGSGSGEAPPPATNPPEPPAPTTPTVPSAPSTPSSPTAPSEPTTTTASGSGEYEQPPLPGMEPPATYLQPTLPGTEDAGEIPVLEYDAGLMPNSARGIQDAQDQGAPRLLHREMDPARIDANRDAACDGFCGPGSPDEYPFASTKEGGTGGWVRGVPAQEQYRQGGILRQFYRRYNIRDGDPFIVRVINLEY